MADTLSVPYRTYQDWENNTHTPPLWGEKLLLEKLEGMVARITELYNHMEVNKETIENDWEHDYLTINTGRDGKDYIWYLDDKKNAAINLSNGEIIDNEQEIEKLFY